MIAAAVQRPPLTAALTALAGVVIGVVASAQPKLAFGLVVLLAAVLLIVRAPVANLVTLTVLTGVIPYGIQNQFGVAGGTNSPGLLLSDLLLTGAIAWALLVLPSQPIGRRASIYSAGMLAFLALVALQFLHGVRTGHNLSQAGAELRVLLGFGTFLVGLPLMIWPETRRRLVLAMLAIAIALGAWGLLQWFGHFSYAGDFGVRPGVAGTTVGTGQLQGSEYGFPVAIVLCLAVLVSGRVRSVAVRVGLVTAIFLNALSCLLTFERTFWLATILGVCLVLIRSGAVQRLKALLVAPIIAIVAIGFLATFAPRELTTAHQRLMAFGQISSSDTVRYRVVESGFVLDRIRAHPISGSGLAATIFWGQAWAQVPPKTYTFSHNGYLWLAWKVGIPAAALLVLLLASALFLRGPPDEDDLGRALRHGAQGAVAGLLLAMVTFPAVSALSITPVMGLLLVFAVSPAVTRSSFASSAALAPAPARASGSTP